jgi:hypothetical protein
VSEEDVPDIGDVGVGLDGCHERTRIVEPHAVQRGKPDREGRMVHEEVDGVIAGGRELIAEPGAAPGAEAAAVGARLDRIEDQHAPHRGFQDILDEAIGIPRSFGKFREQGGPVVVIAGH